MRISGSEVIINDATSSVDLRVRGNQIRELFVVQSSTDRVGVLTKFASASFDIHGTSSTVPFLVHVDDISTFSVSNISGSVLYKSFVEPKTVGPVSSSISDSGKTYTNQGVSTLITFNLPGAIPGLVFNFIVQDVDGLKVVAAAGDTIRISGSVSSAGGSIQSLAIGNSVNLLSINETEWVATSNVGGWTFL